MFFGDAGEVNRDLWEWFQGVVSGRRPVTRYDGIIEVMSAGETVVATWFFDRGLPKKIAGPQLNAKTGDVLWVHPMPSGVIGVPSSFEVDGTQYIAVQSGWGVDSERMRGLLAKMLPEGRVPPMPQGGTIHVFALKSAN